MHPTILSGIPSYALMWGLAALLCVAGGALWAPRYRFPRGRTAVALMVCAFAILIGAKLLCLIEAQVFPFEEFEPLSVRRGFRIPGGMLTLSLCIPAVCRTLRLDWRRFGDALIPFAAVATMIIRVGCFLNGCCFGKPSTMPWAVTFPRDSWVFWYQSTHGWLSTTAERSLPVHPLQLYFSATAFGIAVVLWRVQRYRLNRGAVQMLFYLLFFASTALLEPLRANHLTLNSWLSPVAAAVAGSFFLRTTWPMSIRHAQHVLRLTG